MSSEPSNQSDMPLPPVRYSLDAPELDSASDETAQAPVNWSVSRVHVREALHEPFVADVWLRFDGLGAELQPFLGTPLRLSWFREGMAERLWSGFAESIEDLGYHLGARFAKLRLVPALGLLAQQVDTRAFTDCDVVDVLKKILEPALASYQRQVRWEVSKSYPRCDLWVQFAESHLAFVKRLMADAGLTWFFEQEPGCPHETLVVTDHVGEYPAAHSTPEEPVPVLGREAAISSSESIIRVLPQHALRPTHVHVQGHDWTQPKTTVEAQTERQDPCGGVARAVYDARDSASLTDYFKFLSWKFYRTSDADLRADGLNAEHAQTAATAAGESLLAGLTAGERLHIETPDGLLWGARESDDCPEVVTPVLVSAVEHIGTNPDAPLPNNLVASLKEPQASEVSSPAASEADYLNRFECVQWGAPYRAPRQLAPRVYGPLTGQVVGPKNETVHVDAHGRVQVQMHWQRSPSVCSKPETCWMRVAQLWAGAGFGTHFVPRVGSEVVVQFLDGDPSRPVVVGSLFNGEDVPLHTLPKEKTKTTLRTKSVGSKDAKGNNELTFEDAENKEQVLLKAQRDYQLQVGHDATTTVERNATDEIGGERSVTVGKKQTILVKEAASHTVEGDAAWLTHGKADQEIRQSASIHVHKSRSTRVDGSDKVKIGKDQRVDVVGHRKVKVGASDQLSIKGDQSREVEGGCKSNVKGTVALEVGDTITIKGDDAAAIKLAKKLAVESSEKVAFEAPEVMLSANKSLTLKCGKAKIVLRADGSIQIKGAKIQSAATGPHKLKGGTIHLN